MIPVYKPWLTFWLAWVPTDGITVWPFLFLRVVPDNGMWKHEAVHWDQQGLTVLVGAFVGACIATLTGHGWWLAAGGPSGLLLWYWLYLVGLPIGLPVGWNPFRAWMELQALRAQGFSEAEARAKLRKPPYRLWWT